MRLKRRRGLTYGGAKVRGRQRCLHAKVVQQQRFCQTSSSIVRRQHLVIPDTRNAGRDSPQGMRILKVNLGFVASIVAHTVRHIHCQHRWPRCAHDSHLHPGERRVLARELAKVRRLLPVQCWIYSHRYSACLSSSCVQACICLPISDFSSLRRRRLPHIQTLHCHSTCSQQDKGGYMNSDRQVTCFRSFAAGGRGSTHCGLCTLRPDALRHALECVVHVEGLAVVRLRIQQLQILPAHRLGSERT